MKIFCDSCFDKNKAIRLFETEGILKKKYEDIRGDKKLKKELKEIKKIKKIIKKKLKKYKK